MHRTRRVCFANKISEGLPKSALAAIRLACGVGFAARLAAPEASLIHPGCALDFDFRQKGQMA